MTTPLQSPETKKVLLMTLIDDMTAAAIDRSSQSHIQFLDLRKQLIALIDKYAEEDRQRIDAVKEAMKCFTSSPYFNCK
jgi:hypothetical protein